MTVFGVPVRRGGGWLAALTATSLCTAAAEVLLPATLARAFEAARAGDGTGDLRRWSAWSTILVAAVVCGETLCYLAAGTAAARATPWLRRRPLRHVVGVVLAFGVLAVLYGWLNPLELLGHPLP